MAYKAEKSKPKKKIDTPLKFSKIKFFIIIYNNNIKIKKNKKYGVPLFIQKNFKNI